MHRVKRYYKNGILLTAVILSIPLVCYVLLVTNFAILSSFPGLQQAFSPFITLLLLISFVPSYLLLGAGKLAFYGYFVITPTLLLFSLGIIILSNKSKVFKNLLFYYLLGGLAVLIYTYNSLWTHNGVYYPARRAEPGVIYHVIGLPDNWYDNFYKYLCIQMECRAEKYEILGWQSNEVLVYKKWDNWNYGLNGQAPNIFPEKILQYNTVSKKSVSFDSPPTNLIVNICDSKNCLKGLMKDVRSPMYECTTAYISPNGNKFACIAKHKYGPQDIMIFER